MKYLFIVLFTLNASFAHGQNKVTLEITDESEIPLIGATVVIEGTTTGTITDREGKATLDNLPDGEVEIVISFIGYEERGIFLHFPDDHNKTIEVELEGGGEELEEVVISTTRSSRTIEDIPTRIEAITAEELGEKAAMNSSNIGMLLSETTGVQIQQTSLSSGNLSIRIQGLDGRYTQILKDGFPIYGGFAGGLSIMQIPPLDLKQVELIKGSNSTLYGGGAIAGIVNLISIIPEETPQLSIMLNQTSALGTTGNIFYAHKYGKLGLSIYGSASNQIAYDPDKDGFSNMPKARTYSLNPKLYYYINPKTELSLGLSTSFDDRLGGDMLVIKGQANDENTFSEKNASERYSTQLQFVNSTDERTFSIKNSISFFNRELVIPDFTFQGTQLSSFSEVLYSLHKNDKTDWQFGANYYHEDFKETGSSTSEDRSYAHHTIGGFIQNTTDLSSKFTFEGGLRTDYNVDYGTFILPRIALLYKFNRKLTSRLGGAMGYKLPTIFTEDSERLYFHRIAPISPNINPETSIGGNFDIHYKKAFFNKVSFSINQMFFLTQSADALVIREDISQTGFYYENADDHILSSGFETNLKLTYDVLKLYANYAFVNTQLLYDNINNQKPLTPKHNAGFVLFYEVEEKFSAGYELYYTGSQHDELYFTKPSYWTMGVMLMIYFDKLSVFVNFENFTNVLQTNFEPLVLPPTNNPTFTDIWAPTDGFVFNGGFKFNIF